MGFEHPDSVLRASDFAAFFANWKPKSENIITIAKELNIGLDSLVFIDDNPAERHLVKSQLPMVAVPDIGSDVEQFIGRIERYRYFETISLVPEDMAKSSHYLDNQKRTEIMDQFHDYDEYLRSLDMRAEIGPWKEVYLDRIFQLCNKTNQFNLMTHRYTMAEIQAIHDNPSSITLYGKLSDLFGDNGLVSVLFGHCHGAVFSIETWLMSCRVLKRGMELAMLDGLVAQCQARGVKEILGQYRPTEKNAIVADHFEKLGFQLVHRQASGVATWRMLLDSPFQPRNRYIREVTYA